MFIFFAISSLLGSSLYLYFTYPDYSQQLLTDIFWNLSIMKSKCEEIYERINKQFFPKVQQRPKFIIYEYESHEIENIHIDEEDMLEPILESLKHVLSEKENENMLILFKTYVNQIPYFLRIHNATTIDELYEIKLIKNPFINVDLKYVTNYGTEQTLNISDGLKPYYVKGNVLFDNNFISYFLNITYDIDSVNTYTLEFIDKNCASLKFTHNDVITQDHVL